MLPVRGCVPGCGELGWELDGVPYCCTDVNDEGSGVGVDGGGCLAVPVVGIPVGGGPGGGAGGCRHLVTFVGSVGGGGGVGVTGSGLVTAFKRAS